MLVMLVIRVAICSYPYPLAPAMGSQGATESFPHRVAK